MERAEGRRARTPERKSEKKTDTAGTDVAGAAGATDDEAEQRRVPSLNRCRFRRRFYSSSEPTVTSESTFPVTRTAAVGFGGSATETAERALARRPDDGPEGAADGDAAREPRFGFGGAARRASGGGDEGTDGGLPRPETSLEAIEAELAELRRLEFEATGAVPREFETPQIGAAVSVARGVARLGAERGDAEKPGDVREPSRETSPFRVRRRRNPNPSRWSIFLPKPRAKGRASRGVPPRAPKTKWKRNSLDRDAVAALNKETIKAREEKARAEPMHLTRQNAFAPDRDAQTAGGITGRGSGRRTAFGLAAGAVWQVATLCSRARRRRSKRAAGIPSRRTKPRRRRNGRR